LKRFAIVEAGLIGVVSGLTAVVLKQAIFWGVAWRKQWSPEMVAWTLPGEHWWFLPLLGLLGGALSGLVVQLWGPEAAGSGIPQVKAVLGYVPMPLNLRVAFVKLIGTSIALGSGLSLGRQGPTIQIGAALAAQLSQWVPTSPAYRRQLICAGAAAGLAAGFNAPMAGMLFVIEELLQDFSGLTLGTAILASFTGALVSRLLGGQGLNLSMTSFESYFELVDLPFILLLGLLAGLLGALFSQGIFAGLTISKRLQWPMPLRIGLAGLITGLVGMFFPVAATDNTGLRDFLVDGNAGWQLLLVAFVTKFVLTLVAYSAGAPGGIFAPALVLGSALGCLVGVFAHAVTDASTVSTYALVGMGAFFSAVAQTPLTSVVIVFEITADLNLVLPLMVGTAAAYLVSNRIASGSIYSRLLSWQGINLETDAKQVNPWVNLTAADLMERQVETLSSQMPLSQAMQMFAQSHHRGFPVMEAGKLVGIVTESDLGQSSQQKRDTALTLLKDVMTVNPVTVSSDAPITHVLHLLNQLKVSRLPVTDGARLVGIITRGDIIRAESEIVSGEWAEQSPGQVPAYLVYQTQAPATGQGRLLVPVYNPYTLKLLMPIAIAIAQSKQYEIDCVHVMTVPVEVSPTEAQVNLEDGLALLKLAVEAGREADVSVHTQIRVGHDVAQTLLEVVRERHSSWLMMGWQQTSVLASGRVFGSVVDEIIRAAPCHVAVVRLGTSGVFSRWLVPVAGGPNSEQALALLPGLLRLGKPSCIQLAHVVSPQREKRFQSRDLADLAESLELTLKDAGFSATEASVDTLSSIHEGAGETILNWASRYHSDVILVGASREGLLSHVMKGNIPQRLAQGSDCTLILVRRAVSQG
jgi:chloride channel protein, CIC family